MSIFNQPIDPSLVKQLSKRQSLMEKQDRNPLELAFLNSNTSWVKLQSSINIQDSPDAAKNNILFGGSVQLTKNNALTVPSGLSVGDQSINTGFSYNLQTSEFESNVLGLRPMPGITSISVENIGAYGSTRKATVNFQCWDVKQLEILEALYMRPGYTVLLEFGRSNYLNETSDKLFQVNPRNNFFDENITNLHDYLSELYRASLLQGGNYDAFFGYVVNFKWAARSDGGYNCMTEILSTGEVVESLKINYSLGGAIKYDDLGGNAANAQFKGLFYWDNANTKFLHPSFIVRFNNEYSESILSGLIYELYTAFRYEHDTGAYSPESTHQSQIFIPSPRTKTPITVDFARIIYQSTSDEVPSENRFLYGFNNYYITLESFCKLVTEFIIPRAYNGSSSKGSLTAISTNDRTYYKAKNSISDPLLCLYNTLMLSTNPDVCWIKNDKWNEIIGNSGVEVSTTPVAAATYSSPLVTQSWSGGLREDINKLLDDMFDKYPVSKDMELLLQDIKALQVKFSKNTGFSEDYFYKALQSNYQLVRGGMNNKVRNWDGLLKATANTKKWLQVKNETQTKTFWNIFSGVYGDPTTGFIDLLTVSGNSRQVASKIKGVSVDSNLDKEIQKYAAQTAQVQQAAATANAVSSNINNIADNFKKLDFKKDFKWDKKTPKGTSKSDFGVIGNIYVNLKHLYLLSKNQSSLSSDPSGKNTISLGRYFDSLCQSIQTSLGNVNNFKIHIDPVDGIARIIDLNYINKDQADSLFKFNIGTNNSIVRDLKLESYMSNDMMSMISISAQAEPGKMGYDNTTLTTFNEGITDRNMSSKDTPIPYDDATSALNFISNLGLLVNTYLKNFSEYQPAFTYTVNGGGSEMGGTRTTVSSAEKFPVYKAEQSNSYSNALRDIINFITANKLFTTDNANKSILATEISLTLDGLAGFIIGNLFEVDNTFIPKYYKNTFKKMGYTITGVSQELSDNDWTTTIKAFPVDLGSNTVESKVPDKFVTVYVVVGDGSGTGTGGGAGGSGGSGVGVVSSDCGEATENIIPLFTKYGISYKPDISGNNALITKEFYRDLDTQIFPLLTKLPNIKFIAVSVARPGTDSYAHSRGVGLDFQIVGINAPSIQERWNTKTNIKAKTKTSKWEKWTEFRSNATSGVNINYGSVNDSHPYKQKELTDIKEVENALKGGFNGVQDPKNPKNPYFFDLSIGGSKYQFINENFAPTAEASGPHFHIGRRCGGSVTSGGSKPTPKPKQLPVTKPQLPQPKTNTPITSSSATPPTESPTTPATPVVTPTLTTPPTPPTPPVVTPTVTTTVTPTVEILPAPDVKSTFKFPQYVQVIYTADGSRTNILDEMHAFDSTSKLHPDGTREIFNIGEGNRLVMEKLKKIYDAGINPIVTNVTLVSKHSEKSVSMHWSVEINESTDGLAYTGFTSRGSARNDRPVSTTDIFSDPEKTETGVKRAVLKKYLYTPVSVKLVADIKDDESNFRYLNQGTRHIRQVFYSYTDQNPEGIKTNK